MAKRTATLTPSKSAKRAKSALRTEPLSSEALFMLGGDDAPLPDLWEFWDPFANIPALVVRGAISDLLSPETVAEMKRRKPDLDVVEVPRVGHAPFMTEPEAWAAIDAFLDRVD